MKTSNKPKGRNQPKKNDRIRNWAHYNNALKQRGSLIPRSCQCDSLPLAIDATGLKVLGEGCHNQATWSL